jgi:hypothetical protein
MMIDKGMVTPELTEALMRVFAPEAMKAAQGAQQSQSVAPVPDEIAQAAQGAQGAPVEGEVAPEEEAPALAEPTTEVSPEEAATPPADAEELPVTEFE